MMEMLPGTLTPNRSLILKVVQTNLHNAEGSLAVMTRLFAKLSEGIALVQEPWINKEDQIIVLIGNNLYLIYDQRHTCLCTHKK